MPHPLTAEITPDYLRLLAGLLAAPKTDSLSVLEEISREHNWLIEPVKELDRVGTPRWQSEHTRLFINNYPKTICPPFESAYRDGLMGGGTKEGLTALYLRMGLEARDLPADYLGTILECASWLLEAPEPVTDEIKNELWSEHIINWVPRFAKDMMAADDGLLLYRRLGEKLRDLCAQHG